MLVASALEGALCPRCALPLRRDLGRFECGSCGSVYEDLGSVPCILPNPEAVRDRWRRQLAVTRVEGMATVDEFRAERRKPGLIRSTRARLDAQIEISLAMIAQVDAILGPALGAPVAPEPIPGYQPLEFIHLAHRDWGWTQSDENERATEMVRQVIGERPLGRTLVLGAGACRLAYDLEDQVTSAVAVDVDPLVLLIADRVLRGEEVPLLEARANAVDLDALRADRILRAPRGPTRRVQPLLANGLAPPFPAGSFDTVLTPWFIDLVPPDVRGLLGSIARLLVPAGRWINYGPFLYPLSRPAAQRYSQQEVRDLAKLAGLFEVARAEGSARFAHSPLTGRGRIEPVVATAHELRDVSRVAGEPAPFVALTHLPIPLPSARRKDDESRVEQVILDMLDGQKSIDDIARELAQRTGKPAQELLDAIRFCLETRHPEAPPS
jgi:N2227-like protein